MSVRHAQQKIDSEEFAEWLAYSKLEPFGEERADLRSAIIACVVANANRAKHQRPYKLKDFMPDFGQNETKPQTWQQMKSVLKAYATAVNAQKK